MDPQELVPLEAGIPPAIGRYKHRPNGAPRSCYKGPLRLCRLLALVIVLPSMFILVPLYLRYRVYSGQMYPMSMTDMRLIDSKISPTWCQRQVVRSNATFNAFVVPDQPQLTDELVPVSMTRELELEDDMKEYWGFYLLRGSSVTVSACVRWPGASLIMIKGYKHLQSCAYIGDDSSEELDELQEAFEKGLLSETTLIEKIRELKKVDGKANQPETMKRHKPGVQFHDPNIKGNASSADTVPTFDVTDHDPKELREILEHLHALRQAQKDEMVKNYHPPSHLEAVAGLHRHRDTNVDKEERKFFAFKDIDGNISEQNYTNVVNIKQDIEISKVPNQEEILKVNQVSNNSQIVQQLKVKPDTKNGINEYNLTTESSSKINNEELNTSGRKNKVEDPRTLENYVRTIVSEKNYTSNIIDAAATEREKNTFSEEQSSREVFEEVLQRLQALGDRGKRVLLKLHDTMGVEYHEKRIGLQHSNDRIMSAVRGSEEELDRLRKVLVEAIDEEKTRSERQQKRRDARTEARAKRELMLGQSEFERQLNEDDEPRNYAAEEDLDPDGYAEHHETVNETTAFDMSNSEFWSSFSSSEEALLECEGLILNLPLTPHPSCHSEASGAETMTAARANALTYRVPANGYYFFVFNSENEVQKNYIKAQFDLQKTRYDITRSKLRECTNSTTRCDLALDIFSSQRVVLEVPLRDNDSLWNEQFVIISECEPRTSIYLFCVIAVPILILVFAFQ